ncbi:MAG: hypothetical protein GPI90_23505 [Microcystis aeruginosa K13-05]|uniref:hypothetical protein n=1 Tax=Microcystis sp. LE19-10.1B TaxID=3016428 RepID=UPI0022CBC30A|nr:hypothetical protein [Microcystis sp. LE19-10.1B]MCZ8025998.1 hypothetical protein [Microcystis sp. LE19-10.1B]MCZ8365016.1 hypothetical protein [Microcystis sp. LE19-251.1A]NCR81275.1 hypothetical protein [Microcystis aeruginosa K13-10]NCR87388.1 hypothetical protein [Microcystis aeruginosa K13-05]
MVRYKVCLCRSRSSVISYQLSVISYQLSVISYQLSVISYQLSAFFSLLPSPHFPTSPLPTEKAAMHS